MFNVVYISIVIWDCPVYIDKIKLKIVMILNWWWLLVSTAFVEEIPLPNTINKNNI